MHASSINRVKEVLLMGPFLCWLAGPGCAKVAGEQTVSDAAAPTTVRVDAATSETMTPGDGGPGPSGIDGGNDGLVCPVMPDEDRDHDGYSVANGDCNDCDKNMNPGALDVPGNGVDEDCNGTPDDEPTDCEHALPIDGDAAAAARALGICRTATADAKGKARTWGLLNAAYVFPDGKKTILPPEAQPSAVRPACARTGSPPNPLSHGILPSFGNAVRPRQGEAMAALSSGVARSGRVRVGDESSPDGASMCTVGMQPPGFPISSAASCGDIAVSETPTAYDAIALELVVRAPTNAAAFAFDFDFYTYEYVLFVCSEFNDAFVALLYSNAPALPTNHNIAFDTLGNPVSVNNGFVEVCRPSLYRGTRGNMPFTRPYPCRLGTRELDGTGFERNAATGWLETHANIVPGEDITLRFAIWDAGDEDLDSTVLLDKFRWQANPGTTVTARPPDIIIQ